MSAMDQLTVERDQTRSDAATQSPPHAPPGYWESDDVPAEGETVVVLASDDRGPYVLPFPVRFADDRWWNADTGEELEVYIEGWRERE